MAGMGLIGSIVVGGLAGWIASLVLKIRTGLLINIVLGILGAVILNFVLAQGFHVAYGGFFGQLVVAIIGAGVLMVVLRAVTGRPDI